MAVPSDGSAYRTLDEIAAGDPVTVNAEVDGHVMTFRTLVVRALPDALWLRVASADPILAQLGRGQSLHLTLSRQGGALVAASTFLEHVPTDPARCFAVEHPLGANSVQRREQMRLDVSRRVNVRSVNGAPLRQLRTEAIAVNVSAGGLMVDADLPLSVGDVVGVILELAPGDEVEASAQVVRIDEPSSAVPAADATALGGYRVALRFLELGFAQQDRILRHLLGVLRTEREAARVAG